MVAIRHSFYRAVPSVRLGLRFDGVQSTFGESLEAVLLAGVPVEVTRRHPAAPAGARPPLKGKSRASTLCPAILQGIRALARRASRSRRRTASSCSARRGSRLRGSGVQDAARPIAAIQAPSFWRHPRALDRSAPGMAVRLSGGQDSRCFSLINQNTVCCGVHCGRYW
jgi:hypothetical protein